MFKKIIVLISISLVSTIFSQSEQPFPPLDLVSIPTSGTLPKGSFTLETLLMNDGGILPSLNIGITDNFTIGLSYGIQHFIGDEQMKSNKDAPEVQVKYRIYEENQNWPALVLGLNTQGRGKYYSNLPEALSYNGHSISQDFDYGQIGRYEHKALGFYLVLSKNWNLLGNLGVHLGFNKNTMETDPTNTNDTSYSFKDDDLNFFIGIDKELNRSFSLLLEFDAGINDNDPEIGYDLFGEGKGYLNAAIRWTVAKNLMLEVDMLDISKNNEDREYANRELKIIYFERF